MAQKESKLQQIIDELQQARIQTRYSKVRCLIWQWLRLYCKTLISEKKATEITAGNVSAETIRRYIENQEHHA
jgi:REP element-mobilizing transposase RayT